MEVRMSPESLGSRMSPESGPDSRGRKIPSRSLDSERNLSVGILWGTVTRGACVHICICVSCVSAYVCMCICAHIHVCASMYVYVCTRVLSPWMKWWLYLRQKGWRCQNLTPSPNHWRLPPSQTRISSLQPQGEHNLCMEGDSPSTKQVGASCLKMNR